MTTFARRARAKIESDVRKVRDELRSRADRSVKVLETRGRRIVESFEKQLTRLADAGRKLAGGGLEELTTLTQRIGILEQRLAQLVLELREALQDQEVTTAGALPLRCARSGGRGCTHVPTVASNPFTPGEWPGSPVAMP